MFNGCGYEPPNPHARPWSPASLDPMHKGEYTTCPGYTTKLPEVIEAARVRMHAKMGSLPAFLGKHEATEVALVAMEILEGSTNECTAWAVANPEKKS